MTRLPVFTKLLWVHEESRTDTWFWRPSIPSSSFGSSAWAPQGWGCCSSSHSPLATVSAQDWACDTVRASAMPWAFAGKTGRWVVLFPIQIRQDYPFETRGWESGAPEIWEWCKHSRRQSSEKRRQAQLCSVATPEGRLTPEFVSYRANKLS